MQGVPQVARWIVGNGMHLLMTSVVARYFAIDHARVKAVRIKLPR